MAQIEEYRPSSGPRYNLVPDSDKICYLCGKKGHVIRIFPGAIEQETSAFTCDLYGRYGHRRGRCWEDVKNAYRRPEGWKSTLRTNDDDAAALVSFSLINFVDYNSEGDNGKMIDEIEVVMLDITMTLHLNQSILWPVLSRCLPA